MGYCGSPLSSIKHECNLSGGRGSTALRISSQSILELEEPVMLRAGEKFAVVLTKTGTDGLTWTSVEAGYEYSKTALHTISQAKESLKTQDILHGIQKLKTQITESKASQATHIDIKKLESQIINDTMLIVTQISEGNIKDIIDKVKNTYKSVAILLLQDDNKGRITLAAGVKNVSLKAGEWIKEVAQILGGNGGGRDDFATAGGKDSTKIHKALTHAIQKAKDSIN